MLLYGLVQFTVFLSWHILDLKITPNLNIWLIFPIIFVSETVKRTYCIRSAGQVFLHTFQLNHDYRITVKLHTKKYNYLPGIDYIDYYIWCDINCFCVNQCCVSLSNIL